MSESSNAPNASSEPTATDSGAGAAPTGTAPEPARSTADAASTGFRFQAGPGIPEFAVGKTPAELAALAGDMYQELIRGGSAPTGAQPQQSQYGGGNGSPPVQQPAALQPPTDDDWMNNPGEAARKQFAYERATGVDPRFQQQAIALAQQAREIVRFGDPDTFKRWGPEIDILINQMQPEYRTAENIKMAVGIVKSRHLDELAEERAQAKIQQMQASGGMRSDGNVQPAGATAFDALDLDRADLPDEYRRKLERYRITPQVLDEFLMNTEVKGRGITLKQARDEWLAKARKGDIITEQHAGATEEDR